ncbi:MAG: hypothetical protein AAGA48_04640 [Myxococcota bacterium]
MLSSLLWMSLTGCFLLGGGDDPDPTMTTEETDEPTDSGTGPVFERGISESRVQIVAGFRYNAATGLPGPWFDDGDEGLSAIQIVVGDDQYNGVQGSACLVIVPIVPDGARLITDLEEDQFWGVTLEVDTKNVTTSCDQPGFEPIWDFYDGEVVEFMTTNRDGSPAEFAVIVEEPIGGTFDWLDAAGVEYEEAEVIGGVVQLSDRWPGANVNAIATFASRTDADGNVVVDDENLAVPILLNEVFQNPGIADGFYSFLGYELLFFQ